MKRTKPQNKVQIKPVVNKKESVEKKEKEIPKSKVVDDDIDLIFSAKPKKKEEEKVVIKKKPIIQHDEDFADVRGNNQKKKRKTEDGVNVYSEESLNLHKNKVGGTSQCPFDCDCCF